MFAHGVVVRENQVQTLLYSATIPHWVTSIARQYLKPGYVIIDLVSDKKGGPTNQGAVKVKHLAMRTTWEVRFRFGLRSCDSCAMRGLQG